MKALRNALAVSFLASMAVLAADAGLLSLVMPNAQFVAGIHVDQARNTPFGQFVLSQLKESDPDFQNFIAATGFDPRQDLREVIIASTGEPKRGNGVVLARGRFDSSRIMGFARTSGAITSNYQGADLVSPNGHTDNVIAILDSTTAIGGDPDLVKATLDRRKAGSKLDAKLLARINDLSNRYDAWMTSQQGLSRLADATPDPDVSSAMRGNLMQSIDELYGGVRFGKNVLLAAEAVMRSEKDATAMVDVVRFLASMLSSNTQTNRGNNRDRRMSAVPGLLDTMDLSSQGNIFRLSLTIPEDQLERLLRSSTRVARVN